MSLVNLNVGRTESLEQQALMQWAEAHAATDEPRLALLMAYPAGGLRSKRTAGRMRAEGQKPNVPDLFLPVAMRGFHGAFLEMKIEGGYVTPGQKEMHIALRNQGYLVEVAYGYEQARDFFRGYLGMAEEQGT